MTYDEAMQAAAEGKRVRCDALPTGSVVKSVKLGWNPEVLRVSFEATGAGFNFTARDDHKAAAWSVVEGWV